MPIMPRVKDPGTQCDKEQAFAMGWFILAALIEESHGLISSVCVFVGTVDVFIAVYYGLLHRKKRRRQCQNV